MQVATYNENLFSSENKSKHHSSKQENWKVYKPIDHDVPVNNLETYLPTSYICNKRLYQVRHK